MSREIKFRVWDVKNNVYKSLMDEGLIAICDDDEIVGCDENYEGGYRPATCVYNTDYFILEQYTGLKDKNGVETFENSKINIHQFYFDGRGEAEYELEGIIFKDDELACFSVRVTKAGGQYTIGDEIPLCGFAKHDEWLEITGNIHEHEGVKDEPT